MRISHAAMALVALSFVGCSDDYAAVERGKLVVSPESLTFSLPSPGEGVAEASLTLTNEGAAAVIIRDVVIDENDESVEVSLVDAQDWTSGLRSIIQGESAQMRLRWTVLDAQSDEGVITLDTSAGVVTVPFATVDIDPVLEVSAEPVGQPSDDGMVVEVRDAQAGQVRPVSLTLRGASFAPLTVSQVCLLDNSGQCSGDNVTALGDFVLCAGSVTTPQECEAPVAGQTLLFDDTSKLTMLYKPAPGAVDTTSARVQVSSDSAQTPEFVVTVRGTPCDPTVPGRECVDGSGVPQATIEAPVAQGVYYEGTGVVFEGRVLDTEDGPGDLRVRWESDVDGVLDVDTAPTSDGRVQGTTQLSEGEHFITLIVEDTDGNSGADTVLINVGPPNSPPTCAITAPEDDTTLTLGDLVRFEGQVSDPDITPDALSVVWSSDKDGELGASTPTSDGEVIFGYDGLTEENHTITMAVSDEVGATCTRAIFVRVGTAPRVEISAPQEGAVATLGQALTFEARVEDNQDRPDEVALVWTLDNERVLSEAPATSDGVARFVVSDIASGQHTVTLRATDTSGLTASTQVGFALNTPPSAPTVTILPEAPDTLDVLTANAGGSVDPDGDEVTLSFVWQRGGQDTEYTDSVLPAEATTKNETWTVVVTPNDGLVDGPSGSASVTIENAPPSIDSVEIEGTPLNDSVLSCRATASDPDEEVEAQVEWVVGGQTLPGQTLDLSQTDAQPQDTITCRASVEDTDGATDSQSRSVTLENRAPVVSDVVIGPGLVLENTLVTCSATVSDADGEVLTPSYVWSHGETVLGEGGSLALEPGDVPVGGSLVCTASAQDGHGGRAEATGATTVRLCDPEEASFCNDNGDAQRCAQDGLSRTTEECGDLVCEDGVCLGGCGDGVRQDDEECDNGENNSDALPNACRTNCLLPFCGDGVQDGDEACDLGEGNSDELADTCRTSCVLPFCGDGVQDGDEACDLGEGNSDEVADTCRTNCALPFCGDGVQDGDEACDLGEGNSDELADTCRTSCALPFCGDGVQDGDEECDDGNNEDGDGCSSECIEDNPSCLGNIDWTLLRTHSMTSRPAGSNFCDGAWGGQGIASQYGRTCWVQSSDWNSFWVPQDFQADVYAVEVELYLPSGNRNGEFGINREQPVCNQSRGGITYHFSDTRICDGGCNYFIDRANPDQRLGLSTVNDIFGRWITVRIQASRITNQAEFIVDGVSRGCFDVAPESLVGTYVKFNANTPCCSLAPNLGISNLRIFTGE